MATTARQQYFADGSSLSKEKREFSIADGIQEKIDSVEEWAQVNKIEAIRVNWTTLVPDTYKAIDIDVPEVIDNLYTVDSDNALSAKQWKLLYDYIQNIASRWRFLSNWNSATGLPMTNPSESPYPYKSWDYFNVSNVAWLWGTNYRPDGSSYVIWQASTVVETDEVNVSDFYFYDGTNWLLLSKSDRQIAIDTSLSTTSTNPVENRVITNAINWKQNALIAWNNIQIAADWKTISATDTTYSAWANISINANNEISAVDTKYTAWTNVQISNQNVISATDTKYTAGTWINIDANNVISNTQTSAEWWNITWTLSSQTDLQGALNAKQDVLTAGVNIDITSNKVSANNCFIVTEDIVTVSTDATKWVAPYNTSYGYTNIDISASAGIEWREWAIYTFDVNTEMVVASAYRNVRVKIWNWAYIPVMWTSSILTWSSYFTKANIRQYQYSTKYQSWWALHLFTDSNTTYSAMSALEATTWTATSARTISASVLKWAVETHAPVQSVNWQTWAVTVTVPTKTSDLTNDSGYLTSSTWVTSFNGSHWAVTYTAPVTSVNTKTWAVVLNADNISDTGTTNKFVTQTDKDTWDWKQDKLVSWTNIKTVNSNSLLGSWDITLNDVKSSATAPSSPTEWMVWYDTTNDQLKVYDWSQWNVVWDGTANINTKTFYLTPWSSATAIQKWQECYDWYKAWNNPIVSYNWVNYHLSKVDSTWMLFKSENDSMSSTNVSVSTLQKTGMVVQLNWDTVIWVSSTVLNVGKVLATDVNYSTVYTPQYDWSPATKKYVDDAIAWAWWWIEVDENSPIQLTKIRAWTQAQYEALGSYDSTTVYLTI